MPTSRRRWWSKKTAVQEQNHIIYNIIWLLTHDQDFYADGYADLVEPEYFENPTVYWIVWRAREFYQEYHRPLLPDALEILLASLPDTAFQQWRTTPDDIRACVKKAEAFAVREQIREFALNRVVAYTQRCRISRIIDEASEIAETDPKAAQELLRRIEVRDPADDVEPDFQLSGDIGDFLVGVRDMREQANMLRTGLFKLDTLWNGGLAPNELAVVLAATSVGKSDWLVFVAGSAALGNHKVLVYTLEMSKIDWSQRLLARISGIAANSVAIKPFRTQHIVRDVYQRLGLANADVRVRDMPERITVASLRADIESIIDKGFRPDLIVIDYADLLQPSSRQRSTYEAQGDCYTDLRFLAKHLNVPIWTASQANKTALHKDIVTIKDIADSFKKSMVSDFVVALCQTEGEQDGSADPDGCDREMMRIFIAKARNRGWSRGRQILVHVDHARSLFQSVIDPNDPDEDPDFPPPGTDVGRRRHEVEELEF